MQGESQPKRILVTGGAGFIGSALCRYLIHSTSHFVCNIDKLGYASSLEALEEVADNPRYSFSKTDICDTAALNAVLNCFQPEAILHLAAETHVDRSIDDTSPFIESNICGTHNLLEAAQNYWMELDQPARDGFRLVQVSTDEVFGALEDSGSFAESSPYRPNSPYAASKAAADHLARAWRHTYGLPVLITHSTNNYGPYQFPEKLIPLTIVNALEGRPLAVYGKGENIRDWLYVDDHVRGLELVLHRGIPGETYCFGGGTERRNLDVVLAICDLLDEVVPNSRYRPHRELIMFVADRPGHDYRYAIDATKARREIGWLPGEFFEVGLRKTVTWFLENKVWWSKLRAAKDMRASGSVLAPPCRRIRSMPSHEILIIGRTGQIARSLAAATWWAEAKLSAMGRQELNLGDPASVRDVVRARRWSLVVNCGAYTQVDAAEEDAAQAFAVNEQGPTVLAETCNEQDAALIHFSTDYVFDGFKGAPYDEDDPVQPLSVYGRSKAAGEAGVRRALERHIIVRTSWVFSPWGQNFLLTMLRAVGQRRDLQIVDDQHGCPTYAPHIATVIIEMARRVLLSGDFDFGTYHFCGQPATTWFGFARAIFDAAPKFGYSQPKSVLAVSSDKYATKAKRPSSAILNCAKIERQVGVMRPSWVEGVIDCLRLLGGEHGGAQIQGNFAGRGEWHAAASDHDGNQQASPSDL